MDKLDLRYADDRALLLQEVDNLRRLGKKLIKETEELTKQLEYARSKLVECEERNRQLDWLLTRAVEGRW